ncbi:MAG TPA: class I SAM-dependent methyltransferase [Thermoanaerobaculia bacterium]|nr:class I SAM-dependent methyltransferase [Thermoanaerobaculia bacterium]
MSKQWIERHNAFEVSLHVGDDQFIATSDPGQRNWVVTRALEELVDDLQHLDAISRSFVSGSERKQIADEWAKSQAQYDDTQLIIDGQQVMQDWERPYMEAMAKVVTETHGDVLEIGFGMGISASYIQAMGVRSYTVIECNEGVMRQFEQWKGRYPGRDIRLVEGKWQDVIDTLGLYDGIFFDTYPLSEEEFERYVVRDVTFAQHFFAAAARHLRPGGIFTYYSNEIDSVSRRHQRALLELFSSITFSVCRPLFPPADCNYWWAESMVVTKAIK